MKSFLADGMTMAKRNVIKIKRVPDLLVFSTMQPIMFVLLFGFVFGSLAGAGNGQAYREFMMAGIFAQTIIFGSTITGSSMATDMQKGIIDRFRTLPMHSSAVLFGRTLADVITNVLVLVVMSVTGLLVGWRINNGLLGALRAYLLMLLLAYALSWVMGYIGLLVRTPEVLSNAAFLVIFPLTFIANTFAPGQNMPGVLKTFAGWNPVSAITQAARDNFGNHTGIGGEAGATYTWALQNPEAYTLIWAVLLLVIFVPLSTRAYARATA